MVGWLFEAQKEKGVLTADSFQSQDEKKNGGLAYQEQQMTKEIPSIPASLPVMLKREARKIGPAEILLIKNEKLPLRHSWPPSHTNAICEKWPTLVGHFCFKAGDPPFWVTLARKMKPTSKGLGGWVDYFSSSTHTTHLRLEPEAGLLAGWLAAWFVGWLAGWLTDEGTTTFHRALHLAFHRRNRKGEERRGERGEEREERRERRGESREERRGEERRGEEREERRE